MKTVWIDVDSVLLNLSTVVLDWININLVSDVEKRYGRKVMFYHDLKTFGEMVDINPEKILEFFKSPEMYIKDNKVIIKPEYFAKEFMEYIQFSGVNYQLLTHSLSKAGAKAKEEALKYHFGIPSYRVTHAKDKHLHVKKGDLFIDDGLHNHINIEETVKDVHHYVVSHPWNQTEHKYFSGNLSEILDEIKGKHNDLFRYRNY